MDNFVDIAPEKLADNTWKLIGSDWMLITAGTPEAFNVMTASWGGLGVLWEKKVCMCVIRPQRHTYKFMENNSNFTLSFFDESHRDTLMYCGTNSGKDTDKIAETGLHPVFGKDGIYYSEARLVIIAKKIYHQDLIPENFLDPEIHNMYPSKDYHRMYFGEVLRARLKQ